TPSVSVTVHVWVPLKSTVVFWSTPGPVRWKLWNADWSLTWITYVPAARCVTATPFIFSVMFVPSFVPTVATSWPGGGRGGWGGGGGGVGGGGGGGGGGPGGGPVLTWTVPTMFTCTVQW